MITFQLQKKRSLYDVTQGEDLLQIIAFLRKFKVILETELLD
jgi:hypothetical protein